MMRLVNVNIKDLLEAGVLDISQLPDSCKDINGNLIKRSKADYRYSYDPFVVWKGDYNKNTSKVIYSDRLRQWDSEKYTKCSLEVWGNVGHYFDGREPEEIEKFLSLYMNNDIKLTGIEEGCNVSNGYPYWIFYYED